MKEKRKFLWNPLLMMLNEENIEMELILSIVGALTGVLGIVISILSYSHNRIEAVNAYYNVLLNSESIKSRRVLRSLPNTYEPNDLTEEQIECCSYTVITYQQAGLLVKKKQLPFWVFDHSSGYKVMNFFEKLKPYIDARREGEPGYAYDFEYLYNRLKSKHQARELPN